MEMLRGDLIEAPVGTDDRITLWVHAPVLPTLTADEYVTIRLDGLRLNLKRWLRHRHGYRVRRGKHYMALRITCYGRHNVESKRRINREWSLAT